MIYSTIVHHISNYYSIHKQPIPNSLSWLKIYITLSAINAPGYVIFKKREGGLYHFWGGWPLELGKPLQHIPIPPPLSSEGGGVKCYLDLSDCYVFFKPMLNLKMWTWSRSMFGNFKEFFISQHPDVLLRWGSTSKCKILKRLVVYIIIYYNIRIFINGSQLAKMKKFIPYMSLS